MLARTRGVLGLVPALAILLAAPASAAAQTEEEAIRQTLVEGWVSRSADIHTEMHQPQVTVRGDTAWITYYWTDQSIDRQTGERGTSRGKSTRIFVKENGRWLCINGHYTLVE
ncbi:MAG TPA: DUF4440 domain-containing protein [Gemmatimonadetes bacterium]|nr:DUF4440 domain-containing protein [Gemmatimonadota bacterium]